MILQFLSSTQTLLLQKLCIDGCSTNDFAIGRVLGTGSFGRVYLARHIPTNTVCAIKSLLKAHILKNGQVAHIKSERDILSRISHPFTVRMRSHFQDEHCVYFVMDYVAGGEFFTHLRSRGHLQEDVARFYAAQVVLVFEYLHSRDIIYRDLKPENMLLDASRNLKLADFGFAKEIHGSKRTYTLCGTPDYLAPEIILNKGHGRAVDWWALGILIYEMLSGYPPFCDDDAMGTYDRILRGNISFPGHVSALAKDLIRRLLQTDLSKRLGCLAGGANDVKQHAWFRDINFAALKLGKVKPPIKPTVTFAEDTSNFEDYGDLGPLKSDIVLTDEEQAGFSGF